MNYKLTDQDIDTVTAAMFVMIAGAERCAQVLYNHHEQLYRDSVDYQKLVKSVGRMAADQWVRETSRKVVRQAKKGMLGEWLDTAKVLLAKSERCTEVGICSCKDPTIGADELFNALLNDSQAILRIFLRYGNMDNEDMIKLESTMKAFARRKAVPEELITEYFTPKV